MDVKTLHQEVRFPATPDQVYAALIDPARHTAFTGNKAENTNSLSEDYTTFSGYIVGRNLELVPGKWIHQTWRAVEEGWPEGHLSEVTYNIRQDGDETVLEFTHQGLPAELLDRFEAGWQEWYWGPLRRYLATSV